MQAWSRSLEEPSGWEPNSAAALASQPAAGHNLNLYYYYCFMTLGWGLLVGPAAESCSRIWLPRLTQQDYYDPQYGTLSHSYCTGT